MEIEEGQTNRSEIRRLLDDIQQSVINFENYKTYFSKVKNSDTVIISQIENLTTEYNEAKEKFNSLVKKDSFTQLIEDGFIQKSVFDVFTIMHKRLISINSWKILQEELYSIIFNKITGVLDDARALDIKRDALKEMREMEQKRQEMFIKIMENMAKTFVEGITNKLQLYDEKLFILVKSINEEHKKEREILFKKVNEIFSKTEPEIKTKVYKPKPIKKQEDLTPINDDYDFDDEEANISDIASEIEKRREDD